jgi:hypothetical protein
MSLSEKQFEKREKALKVWREVILTQEKEYAKASK